MSNLLRLLNSLATTDHIITQVKSEQDLDLAMIGHVARRMPFVETESRVSLRPNQRVVFILGGTVSILL